MQDAALQNALAKRAAIGAELKTKAEHIKQLAEEMKDLLDQHKALRSFIRTWYEMAGVQPPDENENEEHIETPVLPAPKPAKRSRPINPDRRIVVDMCVDYIREARRPLMRADLFALLKRDGIEIKGQDPEMVLSTMLWRSKDKVIRLAKGGYWPTGDPLPVPEFDL
jgi:hypothetical protein